MSFNYDVADFGYEDTMLKEMAEDIKGPMRETDQKLEQLREASEKSDARTFRVAVAALVVSALTLLATVLFGLLK